MRTGRIMAASYRIRGAGEWTEAAGGGRTRARPTYVKKISSSTSGRKIVTDTDALIGDTSHKSASRVVSIPENEEEHCDGDCFGTQT